MKTTLNIGDTVMKRLREEAARRDTTMSALVEAGLRRVLEEGQAPADELRPLPTRNAGKPRVDVADREALEALMNGDGPYPLEGE